jgi:NTP pyrophosphatase (non-canonical NTP hydrolase)
MKLTELCSKVDSFVRERGWYAQTSKKPQTAKNLAISLALEASEVLEHFQWGDRAEADDVSGELADVLIYAMQLSNVLRIDLEGAVCRKLAANEKRSWDQG